MRSINLDQLRTLVKIAERGTFSSAAKALHLAQPTVSLHVSELEARLGVSLLVRGGKRVVPTAIGALAVQRARRLLQEADDLLDAVALRASGRAGRVRLATSTGVVARVLPPVLEALARDHDGIEVSLQIMGSRDTLAALREGAIDVGIVGVPLADCADLVLTAWRTDPMAAFVPARWDAPQRATPEWLAAQPLIFNDPTAQAWRLVSAWFAKAGLQPRPRIELNYDEAMKSLVAAGYGAALLPLERPDDPAPVGIRILPLRPALARRYAVVHRPLAQLDGTVRNVLRVLAAFKQR